VIHKYRFNDKVLHLRFSPDGKHIAACKLNKSKYYVWFNSYTFVDLDYMVNLYLRSCTTSK